MGLKLTLRPGERVIINGCVIKNGPRRHLIEIENRADVLRGDDMLDEASAGTPARRVAYHIQIALVSLNHRSQYLPLVMQGLEGLLTALPRFEEPITLAQTAVQNNDFYAAFRALESVIAHEDYLFSLLKGSNP